MKGIVLLDRDGTLIEDVGYLSDPGEVREIPGAAESYGPLPGDDVEDLPMLRAPQIGRKNL